MGDVSTDLEQIVAATEDLLIAPEHLPTLGFKLGAIATICAK